MGLQNPLDFEEAYRAHATTLLRLGWLLTGSKEEAEDILHDVFVRFQSVQPPPKKQRAYLRRMVANEVTDRARRNQRAERIHVDRVLDFESLELDETWSALCELPPSQRDVLILKYYADFSLSEIAQSLELPLGTVKSTLHRGLERLRKDLA